MTNFDLGVYSALSATADRLRQMAGMARNSEALELLSVAVQELDDILRGIEATLPDVEQAKLVAAVAAAPQVVLFDEPPSGPMH